MTVTIPGLEALLEPVIQKIEASIVSPAAMADVRQDVIAAIGTIELVLEDALDAQHGGRLLSLPNLAYEDDRELHGAFKGARIRGQRHDQKVDRPDEGRSKGTPALVLAENGALAMLHLQRMSGPPGSRDTFKPVAVRVAPEELKAEDFAAFVRVLGIVLPVHTKSAIARNVNVAKIRDAAAKIASLFPDEHARASAR